MSGLACAYFCFFAGFPCLTSCAPPLRFNDATSAFSSPPLACSAQHQALKGNSTLCPSQQIRADALCPPACTLTAAAVELFPPLLLRRLAASRRISCVPSLAANLGSVGSRANSGDVKSAAKRLSPTSTLKPVGKTPSFQQSIGPTAQSQSAFEATRRWTASICLCSQETWSAKLWEEDVTHTGGLWCDIFVITGSSALCCPSRPLGSDACLMRKLAVRSLPFLRSLRLCLSTWTSRGEGFIH